MFYAITSKSILRFITGETTLDEAVDFINSALRKDYPVAVLTTTLLGWEKEELSFRYPGEYNDILNDSPYTQPYGYHWMTIVELVKSPNAANDYTIRTLTWGTIADLKLSNYFDANRKFKTNRNLSVIYFIPTI